jgi:perosamine synthetase
MKIPVSIPDLSGNEENYVVDAIRSTWISSTGSYVKRFEKEFAEIAGTRYALSVANGTLALHLAMIALDVAPGDEVIVPSLTYIATANAVKYMGGTPVFVDVDPATWCMDPGKIEAVVTPRTKGIIPVALYGHPADLDPINAIARKHGLWVVDDTAEAHMARYRGRPAGSLAPISTFSFYGNKIITSGEGGALTYDDPDLDRRLRMLRSQGMDPNRRYFFPIIGYNFRLTNIACALLCAQLERKDQIMARRQAIFASYREQLGAVPGIGFQPVAEWAVAAPWLFCITVDRDRFGIDRDVLAEKLEQKGVETRPFFVPLHTLPPYETGGSSPAHFPVTDQLGREGLNLPTFGGMTDEQINYVCKTIADIQRH